MNIEAATLMNNVVVGFNKQSKIKIEIDIVGRACSRRDPSKTAQA